MSLSLGRLRAEVVCGDVPLSAYMVEFEDSNRTIGCYIASEAGKSFSIKVHNTSENMDVAVVFFVDGMPVDTGFLRRGKEGSCIGVRTIHGSVKKFVFTEVTVTGDANLASPDDSTAWDRLGSVEVQFFRVEDLSTFDNATFMTEVDLERIVHERSNKAGTHVVSLSDEVMQVPKPSHSVRWLDTEPYSTFQFQYMPTAILQELGIAPRSTRRSVSVAEAPQPGPSNTQRSSSGEASSRPAKVDKGKGRAVDPVPNQPPKNESRAASSQGDDVGSDIYDIYDIPLDDAGAFEYYGFKLLRKTARKRRMDSEKIRDINERVQLIEALMYLNGLMELSDN
ncbi:uncharacterized protein LAESUDRAFT_750018 [Laetiporus sulphureus 93-53]|uniref:DUF7918 domain-containing protein n=1 Tax=Laetiporus sulphureus 93-53 TaxID=1314785 RepID=A0A165E9E6_9APHY|nr:uncharacterized protein LAESUDRAFT_750018 [Laetiporus sulphureus 93-53]KZT06523.1 hypothetical protein LAESUDRAFT_750018 [Laetiporus sulphureus 93-53]